MTQRDKTITGFSKLSKRGKIKWIVENFFKDPENVMRELKSYWLENEEHQRILDEISENTISNYHLPYGVAPNMVVNGKTYAVPMVTEESSVVAAAASSAKFWMSRGGFHARVLGTVKLGQVHFFYHGEKRELNLAMPGLIVYLREHTKELTRSMEKRGGGVLDIELKDFTHELEGCYQLLVSFETCDSMGANFINSVLEEYANLLEQYFGEQQPDVAVDVLMSILSNYTPGSIVRAWVECPVEALGEFNGDMDPATFAIRFCQAVQIASVDVYRATTHNKGIFNGVDAVLIATGNDFRAIEASGHAYAARDGQYRSLSGCTIAHDTFSFWLEIPLAVGTVGGLTSVHPVAKRSFELLDHPTAAQLMMIVAVTGLAQNFAAVRSLVTTGIQSGHMRMHLGNILRALGASNTEAELARERFNEKAVSYGEVKKYITEQRQAVSEEPGI